MKKLFALILALAMVLSMAACGASEPAPAPEAPAADAPAAEAPAAAFFLLLYCKVYKEPFLNLPFSFLISPLAWKCLLSAFCPMRKPSQCRRCFLLSMRFPH